MNTLPEELADKIRAILNSDNIKLPALPDTIVKIQTLMSGDDFSVSDIAKILSKDSALSAVVMRMANSASFNAGGKEIRNLGLAIQRIGTGNILQLLISVSSRILFSIKSTELRTCMKGIQDHTLMVSATAELIAKTTNMANPADTFMAGLLHDQGKGVLASCIAEELLSVDETQRMNICQMFHREMGARLLHKWKLPDVFILAAQHHGIESPDRPRLSTIDCIDAADLIVSSLQSGNSMEEKALLKHPACQRLRLTATQMISVVADAEDQIDELRQMLAA